MSQLVASSPPRGRLSVLPEARGRGVGKALMDAVERELAHRGVDRLTLAVVYGNEGALRFYARRGLSAVSHVLGGGVTASPGEGRASVAGAAWAARARGRRGG